MVLVVGMQRLQSCLVPIALSTALTVSLDFFGFVGVFLSPKNDVTIQ